MDKNQSVTILGKDAFIYTRKPLRQPCAEWFDFLLLLGGLHERRMEPDLLLIHPDDRTVLVEIMFRAGILVRQNEFGQIEEVGAPGMQQEVKRVSNVLHPGSGKLLPVQESDDAERGVLAVLTINPLVTIGRLTGFQHAALAA